MPAKDPGPADASGKLILLADDDESLLVILERVARDEGFRVERASDGAEALRKAKELAPDLVVLDFMMPGISGFEVLKRLQSGPRGGAPVVLMTGRHVDARAVEMLRQEPNIRALLKKPIQPASFASVLHRILRTRPSK